jgi:glycosyltransferase involved in cell wall biosynthesis
MRILHSTATLSAAQGGPSRAVIDMALAARERGHEVAVFATTYKDPPIDLTEAQQRGVTFHRYPLGRPELLNRPLQRSPALAAALARTLAAGAYDLVHLHSLHLHHCWVTGLICQRLGLPYLLRPHGSFDPYIIRKKRPAKWLLEQLFMNRVIRGAAALHFTAQEEWSLARPWIFNRPGVVVPNSLDCQAYQDLPDRSVFLDKYPEAKGRRIVLFLSRLAAKKGLDLLVPAFAAAQQRFGDLHLVLAGPDHGIAKQVEADLQTHNLRERASITGMIQGAEKLSALAAASCFALPSYSENFGIAVVEALAAGLPVVISDKVNIWREIQADHAGLVCRCSVPSLTENLITLLGDPAAAAQLARAGRATARQRYDRAAVAGQLETAYQGLLAPRAGEPDDG